VKGGITRKIGYTLDERLAASSRGMRTLPAKMNFDQSRAIVFSSLGAAAALVAKQKGAPCQVAQTLNPLVNIRDREYDWRGTIQEFLG